MADPFDVVEALEALAAKRPQYIRYANYYRGDHETRFASDAYRDTFAKLLKNLRYNRCPSVVDAIADRLQVQGWQVETDKDDTEGSKPADDEWDRIQGKKLQGLVHVESLRSGDSYLIVWPDPENEMLPLWRVNRADTCYVMTHDDTAEPTLAIKLWQVQTGPNAGKWRLTIYAPDQITRWITAKKDAKQPTKPERYLPFEDDGEPVGNNPYGVIPVIHFPNNPQFQGECGISELEDVIPLQDGLNYSVWQLMIAGEFTSWPQRYATGVDVQIDPLTGREVESFRGGIDRWLQVASEAAKFGQLPGADLNQFIEVQDAWDQKISRVSRVPVHWLGMASTSDNMSGESLKMMESPFIAKLVDRQLAFGDGWERAMRLALAIGGKSAANVSPVWLSPEPRSKYAELQSAQLQQNVGIPQEQIWREIGYTEDQIAEFTALAKQKADEEAARFAQQFGRGQADGFEDTDAA